MTTPIRFSQSARSTNPETVLSTGLNSLANGSGATSSTVSNDASTEADLEAEATLELASFTPGSAPYVDLYLVPSLDGTTFADTPGLHVGVFPITTGTGAKVAVLTGLPVPSQDHRWHLVNRAGAAFASSGNTLKVRYVTPAIG